MSFFVESITSDDRQIDQYELREAIRYFHTDYTSLEACQTDPLCPIFRSAHPLDNHMIATRMEFHKVEDGRGDLLVHYSWAPIDDAPYYWGCNEKIGKVNLPIFYKHAKPLNNFAATLIYAWEPADSAYCEIEEVYLVKQLTRQVNKLKAGDIDMIAAQHRRLHRLGGTRLYMFLAPTIVPVDNYFDKITYNWLNDKGTPSPRNDDSWSDLNIENDIAFPPDLPQSTEDIIQGFPRMIRKPFTYLVPLPLPPIPNNPIPPKPRIVSVPSGIDDPSHYNDWQDLPGMEGVR